jgi:tetratricopeptide (TPR) repeat protein
MDILTIYKDVRRGGEVLLCEEEWMKRVGLLVLMAVCAAALLACAADENKGVTTADINYWDKKKGDCDTVLTMPHAYSVSQIAYCTKMWEMYRVVDDIPLEMRSMYAIAFSTVSYNASDVYDQEVANAALARICVPRHPMANDGRIREVMPDKIECEEVYGSGIRGTAIASGNPFERIKGTIKIQDVGEKQKRASDAAYRNATKSRARKKIGQAIKEYQEALDSNPFNVAAKYDLACAQAVTGDDRSALKSLEELYTWDDPVAEQRLVKARTDEDFITIRDNPNFKLLTGFMRIIIVNGAGQIGEPTVANIKEKLEVQRFTVSEVAKSTAPEYAPQVWYRVGFDSQAERIKEILGLRKMKLSPMKDADSRNDIIVVWGQPEASQIGAGQSAPVVQGKRASGSENKLQDLVDSVDKTQQNVETIQSTGDKLNPVKRF